MLVVQFDPNLAAVGKRNTHKLDFEVFGAVIILVRNSQICIHNPMLQKGEIKTNVVADGTKSSSITGGLLTNFFNDAISRIAPGLIVLALYAHKQVIAVYKIFDHSSIIFGLSILVAAWLIGVALDFVVFFLLPMYKYFFGKDLYQVGEPAL